LMFIKLNINNVLETGNSEPKLNNLNSIQVSRPTRNAMATIMISSRRRRLASFLRVGSDDLNRFAMILINEIHRVPVRFKIPEGKEKKDIMKVRGQFQFA